MAKERIIKAESTRSPLAIEQSKRGIGAKFGRNFQALWTATSFSNLGDGMYKLVLPVFATTLTQSPSLVAAVTTVLTLPWLLFSLPVGAIVDRVDRKMMMIVINVLRTLVLGLLVVAVINSWINIWALLVVAFLLGVCETFSDTASGALVPSLVSRDQLEAANVRIYGVETVMNNFVGTPLGGYLLTFGAAWAVTAGFGIYAVAVLTLLFFLRGNFRAERTEVKSIWSEITEGVRFLARHRLLRTLAIMVAVMTGCWSAFFSVLVLYALEPGPLGLNEFGYGLLLMTMAVGSMTDAFLVKFIQRIFGRRWLLGLDIVGTITMLTVPALTTNVWMVGIAIFIGGMGGTTWSVAVNSIRQELVPNVLLGRVYGVYRLIGWGTLPLGALIAGIVAEWVNISTVFLGGALLNFFLFIPLVNVLTPENLNS